MSEWTVEKIDTLGQMVFRSGKFVAYLDRHDGKDYLMVERERVRRGKHQAFPCEPVDMVPRMPEQSAMRRRLLVLLTEWPEHVRPYVCHALTAVCCAWCAEGCPL